MKIKKWVSAISALTIAASAFAGMAVTASATVSTPSVSEESDGTVVVTGIPAVLDTGCAIDDTTDYSSAEELLLGDWYVGSGRYGSVGLAKFDITDYIEEYGGAYVLAKVEAVVTAKYANTTGNMYIGCVNRLEDAWTTPITVNDLQELYGNNDLPSIDSVRLSSGYEAYELDVTEAFTDTDTDGVVTLGLYNTNNVRTFYVATNENTAQAGPSLKLTFVPRIETSFNINIKCGDDVKESVDMTGYVGVGYSYSPAAYVEHNGEYYKYSDLNDDGRVTPITGTYADDIPDITLQYDKVDDGMVYYAEAEEIGSSATIAENVNMSCGLYAAMGATNNSSGLSKLVTLPEGIYELSVAYVGNEGRGIYLRDTSLPNAANTIINLDLPTETTKVFTLTKETTLGIGGWTSSNNNGSNQSADFDYVIIRKTGDLPEPEVEPTATYTQIGDYTSETETDNVGSAFTFTVTPGSETIKTVSVKVNGVAADRTATTEISSGSAVFAVAVDAAADSVTSITAVINGEDVQASKTTSIE